jgi:hypothetical protein
MKYTDTRLVDAESRELQRRRGFGQFSHQLFNTLFKHLVRLSRFMFIHVLKITPLSPEGKLFSGLPRQSCGLWKQGQADGRIACRYSPHASFSLNSHRHAAILAAVQNTLSSEFS